MNVLFVTSEIAPFAKTGGLADVAAALPRHLLRRGHDVRVFVPFYSRVATEGRLFRAVDNVQSVEVALGAHRYRFSLYATRLPNSELDVYFVQCPELYGRPAMYTWDADEHLRFLGRDVFIRVEETDTPITCGLEPRATTPTAFRPASAT